MAGRAWHWLARPFRFYARIEARAFAPFLDYRRRALEDRRRRRVFSHYERAIGTLPFYVALAFATLIAWVGGAALLSPFRHAGHAWATSLLGLWIAGVTIVAFAAFLRFMITSDRLGRAYVPASESDLRSDDELVGDALNALARRSPRR